jgi:hypothetical protein
LIIGRQIASEERFQLGIHVPYFVQRNVASIDGFQERDETALAAAEEGFDLR